MYVGPKYIQYILSPGQAWCTVLFPSAWTRNTPSTHSKLASLPRAGVPNPHSQSLVQPPPGYGFRTFPGTEVRMHNLQSTQVGLRAPLPFRGRERSPAPSVLSIHSAISQGSQHLPLTFILCTEQPITSSLCLWPPLSSRMRLRYEWMHVTSTLFSRLTILMVQGRSSMRNPPCTHIFSGLAFWTTFWEWTAL